MKSNKKLTNKAIKAKEKMFLPKISMTGFSEVSKTKVITVMREN